MLKLTRKKAIQITIELWTWLVETGSKYKTKWPGWKKYGRMVNDCPLCEYSYQRSKWKLSCEYCPYRKQFHDCLKDRNPYILWTYAPTTEDRKKYATLFLKQLKQLQPRKEAVNEPR